MDIDNLEDIEVRELINSLKHPSRLFALDEINEKISAMFGTLSISESIIGSIDGIEYILYIYRGQREINRYTLNLRFANKHHQLVRLDIGSGHINPDGTRIKGDHIHFYSKEFPKRDRIAYPLNKSDFPNVENIMDAFSKFSKYTNIQNS